MKPTRRTKKTFAEVLDNVIAKAYERAEPLASTSEEIVIGDLSIINDGVTYNIVDKSTNELKHSHLYLVEAAFLIAKYIQLKDFRRATNILKLEDEYAKHYMDLMFHHNSCTHARKNEDYTKLDLYQMRYRNSKSEATRIKTKIRKMCDIILKKR